MKFTNTDSVQNKVIWKMHWDISEHVHNHVYCHVARQLNELNEQVAKPQIRPIRSTISLEIDK